MNNEVLMRENGFKKTNLIFIVLMSFITFGIYICYWFLSRKDSFTKLQSKDWIPYKWWIFFFVFTIISFLYSFMGSLVFTDYGVAILDSYEVIITFYFLGCLYYSVFRAREMIENQLNESIFKPWLLVIFHIWYLQYKLNKLGEK
ncbi:hypothetical protein [Bacillus methanolicus]|uniref:DUF4234 domain-containing protein n=1 Tax=Bacillus methanolicus (strain MGA3 / ATCC 53907) TaxID=796606 RepID=I3DTZ0_BACMM|nr:hypothetical protein [Bacillus methanolicus]AIE58783.1 hypothetical protein BMMGA3_01545 [Bacillus methanolicus MGA3]EIJ77711.1 hypothetical protein MGA3_16828 [Bacillus methanolicus MGA3]